MLHDYPKTTYGDTIADIYDLLHAGWDPTATVETLADLAGGGRALELGVGTGRLALPLAAAGTPVTGIDVSPAMLARLREKDPDGTVEAIEGDFADFTAKGEFAVAFAVNSLLQLTSLEEQRACLRRVREHLAPGGVLVLEEANPAAFTGGGLQVMNIGPDRLQLLASQYDPMTQQYRAQQVILRDGESRLSPVALRLTTPTELDLMAELCGMRLRERWADWRRTTPYTLESRQHVSFYDVG